MNDIYETLPEKPVVPDELRNKILEYLKKTPNNWHNVLDICRAVGFDEKDKTRPTIRLACKELLHFEHQPIATCHAGFTYATQENIMRRFQENMEARIKGMQRTVNDIKMICGDVVMTSEPAITSSCMGAYDSHLYVEHKEGGKVCIRCGGRYSC